MAPISNLKLRVVTDARPKRNERRLRRSKACERAGKDSSILNWAGAAGVNEQDWCGCERLRVGVGR